MAHHDQQELFSDQPMLPGLEDVSPDMLPNEAKVSSRPALDPKLIARQIYSAHEWAIKQTQSQDMPDIEDDPRYRTLVDAAGFSPDRAKQAITGNRTEKAPQSKEPSEAQKIADDIRHAARKLKKIRPRRFEVHDSDVDPNWTIEHYVPQTTEEIAAVQNGTGLRSARVAGVEAAHNASRRRTAGQPENYRIAAELAAQELRARNRAG